MRKRISSVLILILTVIFLCSCGGPSKNSTFSIRFIDVGQGDSALVECDGHYMLIDGGDKKHGENVYNVLEEEKVRHLDILAISHFHKDHYAGLTTALANVGEIDLAISNTDSSVSRFMKLESGKIDLAISNTDSYDNGAGIDEEEEEENAKTEEGLFYDFTHELSLANAAIKVPHKGDKYDLGSATVEVVDASSSQNNDSLVLLITYGKTKFLFTGDIEEAAQKRIYESYQDKDGKDKGYKLDLIKVPHHGSYTGTLYAFFRTFMPDYVVISVGQGNRYGHPDHETMDLLTNQKSDWRPRVYRTDQDGDVIVKSNGKELSVQTSK